MMEHNTVYKWDIRFARLAKEISTWSKDPSSQIGAIIVDKHLRILGTGYNGFPKGIADTEERLNNKEEKYSRIIHAETNALLNCLRNGVPVAGATLYVYGLPICLDCTKLIVQSGIHRVVMAHNDEISQKWFKSWTKSFELFCEAGILCDRILTRDL